MNQELIDLLRGELPENVAAALREKIAGSESLTAELRELEALFGLVHRAESIEPAPRVRRNVMNVLLEARRPSLWAALRENVVSLPGLVLFRLQRSLRFRVAFTAAVVAHVVAIGFLATTFLPDPASPRPVTHVAVWPGVPEVVQPERALVVRLGQRRLPKGARLDAFGVQGQGETIRAGLLDLALSQRPDGSFGSVEETGFAALALLAEGDCSAQRNERGRRLDRAMQHLFERWTTDGKAYDSVLAAMVEDYVLSYERMGVFEREERVLTISEMIPAVIRAGGGEGLALARMAGFRVPLTTDAGLGEGAALIAADRARLLDQAPTRVTATAALARGVGLDRQRVRAWVKPLFERSQADLQQGKGGAVALLTLQSPYRL